MNKQQALKQMNDATNTMSRLTEGTELYSVYKKLHTEAKAALIAIWEAEQKASEVIETVKTDIEVIEAAKNEIKVLKANIRYVSKVNGLIHNATAAAREKLEMVEIAFNKFVLMLNMANNGYDCEDLKNANKIKLLQMI